MAGEDVLAGLTVMSCGRCGIPFAMPTALYDENLELGPDGPGWHCPNGHARHFIEAKNARKRRQEEEQRRLLKAEREAKRAREAAVLAARTCPWPTCDGRVLASERGLRQHMVKAHGAPWSTPEVTADEVGQVLNGRDPAEVVR